METRALTRSEVELLWTIDRNEVHDTRYEMQGGALVRKSCFLHIGGWAPGVVAKETPVLYDCFDRGGAFCGVFDDDVCVGVSVVEIARVGRAADQIPLAYLYVSRDYRSRGIGTKLFESAVLHAREKGVSALYVSATCTGNTVDFYLRRGCILAPEPDAGLLAAEPTDIHLIYSL